MEILVCTSHVKNLDYLFYGAENYQGKLYLASYWDTSNVTSMVMMFDSVRSRFGLNLDLRGWDTSKVTTMQAMFHNAKKFNTDLTEWDVSKVTNHDSFAGYNTTYDPNNWPVFSN